MLVELSIRNFTIIEDLNVKFTQGLNVISGETGSGKSVLIEALGMILGDRVSKDYIQEGFESSYLTGVFFIKNNNRVLDALRNASIPYDEDGLLIIEREINFKGPNISRINGKIVNLFTLKNISGFLIDIFGQYDHQSLINSNNHILILDQYLPEEYKVIKKELNNIYESISNKQKLLEYLELNKSEFKLKKDLLEFQIKEIEDSQLSEDDENIFKELKRYEQLKDIIKSLGEIRNLLESEDHQYYGINQNIRQIIRILNPYIANDKIILNLKERFENSLIEFEEINRDILTYLSNQYFDEERFQYLYQRNSLVNNLKNKYGSTIEEIITFYNSAIEELKNLDNIDQKRISIKKDIDNLVREYNVLAKDLSNMRVSIAKSIELNLLKELKYLNMENVKFETNFSNKSISSDGIDNIEFLISTNLGEPLKPLSKIVSGGEMSRIMLAFKSILANNDYIPTMVFDEIDSGISGRTAQLVGEEIFKISTKHQVICISHLPQISSLSDSHYLIEKKDDGVKTISNIKKLNENEKIEEIARIIGGVDLTETTLKHSKEMIYMANNFKKEYLLNIGGNNGF